MSQSNGLHSIVYSCHQFIFLFGNKYQYHLELIVTKAVCVIKLFLCGVTSAK